MENSEYIPNNREKSRRATKHKFWCFPCDMAKVGEHGKCPVCGNKNNKGKKTKSG